MLQFCENEALVTDVVLFRIQMHQEDHYVVSSHESRGILDKNVYTWMKRGDDYENLVFFLDIQQTSQQCRYDINFHIISDKPQMNIEHTGHTYVFYDYSTSPS